MLNLLATGNPNIPPPDRDRFFVVMSAGNNYGEAGESMPGCWSNRNRLITVGSVNCNKSCALYSNAGAEVDFVTVGTNIFTIKPKVDTAGLITQWGYGLGTGTSMSAAVVSGLIYSMDKKPKYDSIVVRCMYPHKDTLQVKLAKRGKKRNPGNEPVD
ncbi:MAG: S8/S53 family peptidase [Cytophagales bacterium]|nr:S8/S53 family peptidase [Cytophagales bacterium]